MRKQGAHEKKRNHSDGKTRQNYIHGAAILTVGVIVMKFVSPSTSVAVNRFPELLYSSVFASVCTVKLVG